MELDQKEYWKNETVSFLAISSIKGVGYWSMHKIAEAGFDFSYVLKSSTSTLLEQFVKVNLDNDLSNWEEFQRKLWEVGIERARHLAKNGIRIIFRRSEYFPSKLSNLPDAPYWLFIQGNLENLNKKSVAIVGTRKPTEDGLFLTKLVVAALANRNLITISGLANGIDQIAHTESLRYGIPTIAILGTGIFDNFPKGSEHLRERIINAGGTIISEYLPDQTYSAENFVRRNRIQAGLCDSLLPIEWQIKSGTAHTVEFAYKYLRQIINVYLPNTYTSKDELQFSEKERGASSCELPLEINRLINLIESSCESNNSQTQPDFDTPPSRRLL